MTNKPLSVGAHGRRGGKHGISLGHMAHKTRPILADENETRWRMLPRSGKVTFCKLTDLEKRGGTAGGRRSGTAAGPPDVDRGDSLIHKTTDFYRVRLKKNSCRPNSVLRYSSVSLQMGTSWTKERREKGMCWFSTLTRLCRSILFSRFSAFQQYLIANIQY